MAGKTRHMINRSGRYHARLVVPKDLRAIVGKTELRKPLGGDYRQALRLLPGAVAQLQHEIALAEQRAAIGNARKTVARYPLAPDQIAFSHYMQRLALDDELRNDPRYSAISIDDSLVVRLREAIAGRASDEELASLVGYEITRFRAAGNIQAEMGSTKWREIARALCHAELEALARAAERDEGDFTGTPSDPMIANAQPPQNAPEKVSLKGLWADYIASRVQAGFMRDGGKRIRPVEDSLRKFLGHDDALRVTKRDLLAWRDHLMQELSAKTVNDIHLSAVRSLFGWAVENDRLAENVAANVRQPKPKKVQARERGYTDAEAVRVLKASRSYQPNADDFGRVREKPHMINAKKWVPILCAFTGARVAEITQLRKEDIRQEGQQWIARITPDAGTVKAGGFRDVPLHPQIIKEGFAGFVLDAPPGPLFHDATDPRKFGQRAAIVAKKVGDWLRLSRLTPNGLQPSHAWRHRFKTQCRELGVSDRVAEAIQGHAGRTAGDSYGDVTIRAKIDAINLLPPYTIEDAA